MKPTNKHLKPGSVFAVIEGIHKGKFAVCIQFNKIQFEFLFLPEMESFNIPFRDVAHGFDKKVIKFVENLPADVFSLCQAQHQENNK